MRDNEVVIKEINSVQSIPFRFKNLVTIPYFIFFGFVVHIMIYISVKENATYQQLYFIFILPLIILFVLSFTIGRIFVRYRRVKSIKYRITNQRILFLDKQFNNVLKSFELSEVELDYTENVSKKGHIILKKDNSKTYKEYIDSISVMDVLLSKKKWRTPLFESTNIIYNVEDVNSVFNEIREIQKSLLNNNNSN